MNIKISVLLLLTAIMFSGKIHSQNYGSYYATFESETPDSIYIAINNASQDTVCVFTGYINNTIYKDVEWDQMAMLHRYNTITCTTKLSFVPVTPFIDYKFLPFYKHRTRFAWDHRTAQLLYRFTKIAPGDKFIYPISKSALKSRLYIYDYDVRKFPFWNRPIKSEYSEDYLEVKYPEFKICPVIYLNDGIDIEFAVWSHYDRITENQDGDEWYGFHNFPEQCMSQLMDYDTISIKLFPEKIE